MSNYPPPGLPPTAYPQPDYPPPPPQSSGCGGCLGKFFIVLGVLFFLMIALCCGGVFYFQSYFKNSITQKPGDVQAVCDDVTAIRVPDPPLAPAFGGRFKMPFSGTFLGEGAVYTSSNKKAVLVVASISDTFGPQFKDGLMKGLQTGPNEQKPAEQGDLNEALKDATDSTVERTIRGETAKFHVSQGTGVISGKRKIKVNGDFQGKTGPAILVIMAEEETLPREKVDEIINSIDGGGQGEKK